MFSQACVKNSVHKGVYPSMHWAGMCVSQHGLGGGVADTPSADTPGQTSPFPDSHCSGRYASYWNALLLPPANEVCEGYIFYTCVSFCPRGGACIVGRGCAWWGGGLCIAGGHVWQGGHAWWNGMRGTPPQILRDTVILSMSGRYASYWNAFLFGKYFEPSGLKTLILPGTL